MADSEKTDSRQTEDMVWVREVLGSASRREVAKWSGLDLKQSLEEIAKLARQERQICTAAFQSNLEKQLDDMVKSPPKPDSAEASFMSVLQGLRREKPYPTTLYHYLSHSNLLVEVDVSAFVERNRKGLILYTSHFLQALEGIEWVALASESWAAPYREAAGPRPSAAEDRTRMFSIAIFHETGEALGLVQSFEVHEDADRAPWIHWGEPEVGTVDTEQDGSLFSRLILRPGPLPNPDGVERFVEWMRGVYESRPGFREVAVLPGRARAVLRTDDGDMVFRLHHDPGCEGGYVLSCAIAGGLVTSRMEPAFG